MGGKALLVKTLLRLIPRNIETYCEVFGGAGNLLLSKPPSNVEVWNDLDGELANLMRVIKTRPRLLIRTARAIPYSRVWYERLQREVKSSGLKGSDVQRAAKFWFLLRASFFGHPEKGWRFALHTSESMRLENGLPLILAVSDRLRKVYIDCLDFRRCIKNWDGPDTFFFIDPPYYGATKYRSRGPQFTTWDHEDLAKILAKVEAKWLLTLNDRPQVRKLYRGYRVTKVDTQMATAKVAAGEKRPRLRQLIIRNYKTR
ncbi:MAG: DNA adenine methylase [Candidatus Bathyarchaeia archaeon]|jgi:DNA adenine methylase